MGRPAPGRRPPTLYVLLAVAGSAVALFILVTANVMLGQAGFSQADLDARVAERRIRAEELAIQVERLKAPGRIATEAATLGMVPGTDPRVLVPPSGGGASPRPGR